MQFDFVIGNEFDGYGETVLGRKGSLVLEDERKAMLFHTSDVDKPLRVTLKKNTSNPPVIEVPKDGKGDEESEAFGRLVLVGADQGFAAELQHWAFCCKPAGESKADYDLKPRCDTWPASTHRAHRGRRQGRADREESRLPEGMVRSEERENAGHAVNRSKSEYRNPRPAGGRPPIG